MGDGSSGGATQPGAQRGITLAGAPSWAAGDRLMPQSMMQAMAVAQPYTPGVTVVSPSVQSTPQDQPQVPSIPQSPLNLGTGMSFSAPLQTNNTMINSPQGNGINNSPVPSMPSADQMGQFQPSSQASNTGIESGEVAVDNPKGTVAGVTQGQNPTSFQLASHIQSLLPQVQSDHSGAPASNASVNVAQAPSQSNPVASPQASNQNQVPTSDQNLDQASKWVLNELEGSELTLEKNGRYSRWGIGSDPDEPLPKNVNDAQQFLFQKYINQNPDRQAILSQLSDPRDQAAYLQGILLNPKPIDNFVQGYPGQVGGQEWRNSMLNTQAKFLYSLAQSNPQKYGGSLHGWLNRINEVRNWNPQQQGNT